MNYITPWSLRSEVLAIPDDSNWGVEHQAIVDKAKADEIAELRAALAQPAKPVEPDMVSVKREDANNYCLILSALGIEEEGDPVAAVESLLAPPVKPVELTDEQDRALCEAYCNNASDEYFNARPQLDSGVNRRIFYAGHRKAWLAAKERT